MDRHLSPTETARRFGVSIKALRLYEQRGLLTPLRSEAGWRTYGPDQIGRLHQVLTLKGLGLPLAHSLPSARHVFGEEVRSAEHFFAWFAHLGRTGIYRVHEVARTRAALRALHVL